MHLIHCQYKHHHISWFTAGQAEVLWGQYIYRWLISSSDNHSQSLITDGITILFVIMIAGIIFNMKSQKISREEQVATVQGILLSNMLEHLSISLNQYFRKTSDRDRERHILNCKRCSCLKECVHSLLGEDIDPDTFCQNCKDLKQLTYNWKH